MVWVLDASAILAVPLEAEGAEQVVSLLRSAAGQREARVLVPFTAMEEVELYLRRHVPDEVDRVLALVEGWPVEIVESYPQWRHEAVRLQASLDLSLPVAWAAALALLHDAELVYQDVTFEAIPGLVRTKIA